MQSQAKGAGVSPVERTGMRFPRVRATGVSRGTEENIELRISTSQSSYEF
ncbi:hypothetical protein IQ230_24155 [Gloeocapsopsis crepidinum LEGE 06123]|uniref:Uncharacterized protein n=1 Tax=Gloeocapsopsis crepidinum LEGE 06123 TaxID=588587 RepID=A0ABR9UYJ4_9CHRO|nr:hypothetical protein [Gloeocapsopsis crepidinum LEGE 06123]